MSSASEVIALAKQELGYHEKASNSNLDSKTGNSGSSNYTKYARDLANAGYYQASKQGFEWCDMFVDWLFYKLYGKTEGERIECQTGVLGAGTPYSAGYYKAQGRYDSNPQPGDQIFFQRYGSICHTGLVIDVKDSYVYTIEGNSNNQVEERKYKLGDSYIAGYGHPKYSSNVAPKDFQQIGVDVSYWNGRSIDWKAAKKGGIDFAIVRAGYGKNNIDSTAELNAKGASAAGVNVGYYWFSYASTAEEAKAEANYCCDAIEKFGVKPNYPVCFDYEYNSEQKAPPKESIVNIAKAFLAQVKARGYYPCNYTNIDYLGRGFDQLTSKYDTWLAQWEVAKPGRDCTLWQYSSDGQPSGFSGRVDMNVSFKDYPSIISGDTPTPTPTPTPDPEPTGGTCMFNGKILKNGSQGTAVESWQTLLVHWGYNCGTPDGIFGGKTEGATIAFQRDYGLEADGIVGPKTWEMMIN